MIQTFTSVHPRQTAAVTFSFNIWNSLFCGPPSSHFPLENKDFFLNFNIESRLNVVQLLQDRYSVTSNMKTGLFSFLFELLLSSFFFLHCFHFLFLFFFNVTDSENSQSPSFFLSLLLSSTGRLPPSAPCSSSLPLRVCPAGHTQKHQSH